MAAIFNMSKDKADAWLQLHFQDLVPSPRMSLPRYPFRGVFDSPTLPESLLSTARSLVQLCSSGEVMVLLTDWYQNLLEGREYMAHMGWIAQANDWKLYRRAALLNMKKGEGGIPIATDMIQYLVAFGWEGVLYDPTAALYIWVADEVIEVSTGREDLYRSVLTRYAELNVDEAVPFSI